MRLALLGWALATLAGFGGSVGCVSELSGTVERRCPESAVEVHAEQTGLEYSSCGSVEGPSCVGDDAVARLGCLSAALDECTPARLDVRTPASAGELVQIYLVEPDGTGGCRIVILIDDRGYSEAAQPGIWRAICDSPSLRFSCDDLVESSCSEPTSLCRASRP